MIGKRESIVIYFLVSFLVLMTPGQGYAGTAEREGTEAFLEEVVVTGSRIEEEIAGVPANITVISEKEIRASNAKTVVELLRSEEGIVVRDLLGIGRTAQVDLRGFGESGSSNTLVLVDGRRINAIDLSGVNWSHIPIDQVARIEILRGTGSVLYGDNAVGGVINIITKEPEEGFSARTSITAGSFGRTKEQVSVSAGKPGFAASADFSYDSSDGYRENNYYRAKDASGRILYQPADTLSLHLDFSHHSDDYGMPGALNEADYNTNRRTAKDMLDRSDSEDSFLRIGFDSAIGDYGTLLGELSYRHMNTKSDYPDPSFPFLTENDIETYGFTPRFVFDQPLFERSNTFIAGADLYRSDQTLDSFSGTFSPVVTPSGRDTIKRESMGFYMTNEMEIFENLRFSAGARTERVEDDLEKMNLPGKTIALKEKVKTREEAFNLGLSYKYKQDSTLFLKVNRSFRYPLTDELIEIDQATFATGINTDLEPQTGMHYDIGVKHSFNKRFHGRLTLFRAEIKNEIFYDPLPKPYVGTNENHPETLHQGIEAGLTVRISDKITFNGNYT
ncbi:MAG TPA: TonB-dependent receptor, partial [Desulfobacteraceae bacterium]|nr:TonB-dependent receptor [Desulfobacteraceae bacterium]